MSQFLPVTKKDMEDRGWDQVDFVYVTGDAYVDHSSFGTAIISRFWKAGAIKWELSRSPTGAGRRVLPYLESLALASL